MDVNSRIMKLRDKMEEHGISIYIVPTSDYHQSEYVSDYFKAREFITGFTGSAGTAVITREGSGLWTDGRYFIQAERELTGSEVRLYRMGMEGVPDIPDYLREHLQEGDILGFDGGVVAAIEGERYGKLAAENGAKIKSCDLIAEIWKDRPAFPKSQPFVLEEKYAGKSVQEKLAEIREELAKQKADAHVLNDACDIAWLLNIRGGDISHVPVILSFLYIDHACCKWYVKDLEPADVRFCDRDVRTYLEENGIEICRYEAFYSDLRRLSGKKVLADHRKINVEMAEALQNCERKDGWNPAELKKAVKNKTEIENLRRAHIQDGVAVTKFMYWLKKQIGKEEITEMTAAARMDGLRRELEDYVDLSFDTIAAYGENAAMMHYEPDASCDTVLQPRGFLLVDSGGHYLTGSTDITRTFVLGELTKEERQMFTAVVRSNLTLANARFLKGCDGSNLDILAREPLWQMGVDYRCGTGHGNGYLLNVHEGPNAFRYRKIQDGLPQPPLEAGMVTTDEPGVYEEGKYGIRIENELLCVEGIKNEYGQFMKFETITYAPIDKEGIDPDAMTAQEKQWLNEYHAMVYKTIHAYLTEEEATWLKVVTAAIA